MKKDNKNKTAEMFEMFLPDKTKDDPNENFKKEKKLFSIIFIVISSLLLVANLIAMIINFCFSLHAGLDSLFVGFINCAISIFLLGLLVVMLHNISKITRATLFICSKLMKDEKRLLSAEAQKEKAVKQEAEIEQDTVSSEDAQENDEEDNTVNVDIIVEEN